ncbi:MAG: NUDIX domain-containing protein [Prolixibacteraceae bacterium]|jgi:isopentenyldiphosphate isomerase/intracellular septation protein A
MNRSDLFKKLLPGFIPLFVFIAIDEIWGTRAGLVAALFIGIAEMLWIWFKERRFDKFVLFDTGLLVVLGSVSILLNNDIFFKLKPGLVELILCAVLAVSSFSKLNIVGLMTQRYMKDVEMNEQQMAQFRKTMQLMFFVFLIHTLLVFYSAFFMSDAAWAFVSGGLFYILFAVVFAYEFIRQRVKNKKRVIPEEEWLPLVDENGVIIGKAPRSVCHNGQKLLHPVVHLHVLNNQKNVYLQMRPPDKLVQPGKWDTSVGGHISVGETLETALKREAWEEIGLQDFSARLVKTYRWDSEFESELVYVFVSYDYKSIHLHSDEVQEGRFWTIKQIENNIGKGLFTPNFEYEFQLLRKEIF